MIMIGHSIGIALYCIMIQSLFEKIIGKRYRLLSFNVCSILINLYISYYAVKGLMYIDEPVMYLYEDDTDYHIRIRSCIYTISPFITGYSIFTLYGALCLGTEKNWDGYIHHIVFVVICLLSVHHQFHSTLSIAASAMEVSTPAFIMILILQESQKYPKLELFFSLIFFILFSIFRIGYFTYHIWYHGYYYNFYIYESFTEQFVYCSYLFVWGLQVYWYRFILRKVIRKCKKNNLIK